MTGVKVNFNCCPWNPYSIPYTSVPYSEPNNTHSTTCYPAKSPTLPSLKQLFQFCFCPARNSQPTEPGFDELVILGHEIYCTRQFSLNTSEMFLTPWHHIDLEW